MNEEDLTNHPLFNKNAEIIVVDPTASKENPLGAAMVALEEQFEQKGWDQPPSLVLAFAEDGAIRVETFPLPEAVKEDPSTGLPMLADHFSKLVSTQLESDMNANAPTPLADDTLEYLTGRLDDSFFGIGFVFEAWTLGTEPNVDINPDEWADYTATALTRQVHLHPNRREMRGLIFRSAHNVFVERIRGETPTVSTEGNGRLAVALDRLVQVCVVLIAREVIAKGWRDEHDGPEATSG